MILPLGGILEERLSVDSFICEFWRQIQDGVKENRFCHVSRVLPLKESHLIVACSKSAQRPKQVIFLSL